MPMGNSFFLLCSLGFFRKKNSGQLQRKSENSDKFICLHVQMSFDSWLSNCESNQSGCVLEHRSCNRNLNITA
jgi:hypothetical protein